MPNGVKHEEMAASAKDFLCAQITQDSYKAGLNRHVHYSLMKDCNVANMLDYTKAACMSVKDVMALRWFRSQKHYYVGDLKRVYYLSMEFYLGRALNNSLICLGNEYIMDQALHEFGLNLEELEELEVEAGLGNGGLGRLAACFLDSMTTLGVPAQGYGLKYEYGMFTQVIKDGYQYEEPDNWLKHGNPWMVVRPEYHYPINFGGCVDEKGFKGDNMPWQSDEIVLATPSDIPIPGYRNDHVNTLRLWTAKAREDFNFSFFNSGDYVQAVMKSNLCENITKVLYPNDKFFHGKQLRLRQEYLLVAASLKDIVRKFKKTTFYQLDPQNSMAKMHEKVAIQVNDTHPSMAIPELMRILMDLEGVSWNDAWNCTVKCMAYTNHTVMSEGLEKWSVALMQSLFPRHLQIIYEINNRFLKEVKHKFGDHEKKVLNMSLVTEETEKKVVMAHLAIVGSHIVNGVSAIHTHILKKKVFKDFVDMFPDKFINITNGITPRRWLLSCNPGLANLITQHLGLKWLTHLTELKNLTTLTRMEEFCLQLNAVKLKNKKKFAEYIKKEYDIDIDYHSLFDFQVKRLHGYKRQLLNILHVITIYNRLRANPNYPFTPRTVFMGGKAAPGYQISKIIIKLFNNVAAACNSDPNVRNKLNCVFLPNYNVTLAEKIMPTADLSQQISLAGTEASGTGNMKFMLNGALTIGTLDGVNVEMREQMGEENFFLFGLSAPEAEELRTKGYSPSHFYISNPELNNAIEQIDSDYFSPGEPHLFGELANHLTKSDQYMVCADYESYINCQEKVGMVFKDRNTWDKMMVRNIAASGYFSSDRAVAEYCEKVWNVEPFYGRMDLT